MADKTVPRGTKTKKMETIHSCPVCESTKKATKNLTCTDDTVSKETFEIKKCTDCGFMYTDPRPEENELYRYYESEDYVSHSNTSKGLINFLYQNIRKYTLVKKVKLINSLSLKDKILDIGSGTGDFLNACKQNGWETTGIEPNENARLLAINNHKLDIKEEADINTLKKESFNVITMWHVLEHVPQLNRRVEEIKQLLKRNGTLIVAVPNRMSFDAQHYKENWAGYDVPRHLYHFSPKDIEKLFSKHGFEVIKTKPMIFDAFYVSMLSEKIKTGKAKILKGFVNGLVSNILSLIHEKTSSSQIYIIKKTS